LTPEDTSLKLCQGEDMNTDRVLKEDLIFTRKHFERKEEVNKNKRVYDFLFLKVLFSFYWFIA